MKVCSKCGIIKTLSDFHRRYASEDGRRHTCKGCDFIYNKSESRVLVNIYAHQKESSARRGHKAPAYSRKELSSWAYDNGFKKLYDIYADSGYLKNRIPSVDRINDELGYSFGNIRLTDWEENLIKSRFTGMSAVVQYSNSEIVDSFISTTEAAKNTGIARPNITNCCRGKRKSAGGFTWEYLKEKDWMEKLK